ncbi:hypothetical protein jhhlp_002209 [Lomentospora prolificans]|uniref:RNA helicase n=1 Tax=Lomentospora prolificans TaxID=41688 RepID=A0A2N3NDF6_9PEZI|nr:hypothetical protein jhhlp_002209 [Lomentospora prolificans]
MKKFGFSKKSDKGGSPASDNPYAQQPPAEDPYSGGPQSMNQGSMAPRPGAGGLPNGPRAGLPSGPRGRGGFGGPPAPRPAPPQQSNSYGSQGYGSDKYGSGGGYGGNRYDNNNGQSQSSSGSSRPGGYGGLAKSDSDSYRGGDNYSQGSQSSYGSSSGPGGRYGNGNSGNNGNLERTNSSSTEVNRGELFGGAQNRYNPERGNVYKQQPPQDDQRYGQGKSAVAGGSSASYGGYGEQRELTEEEQEEQKVQNTMAQTSEVRNESIQSQHRTLQHMYQSIETGRGTLSMLASQGERLQNAERNMDLADNYNAVGFDKTKELQTVNRSMFSVHVSNPFTAKKRAAARDQEVMDRHRMEKEQREATRRNHYSETQTVEQSFRALEVNDPPPATYTRVPREQNKYIFADEDSDEDRKEQQINDNLDEMFRATTTMKGIATQLGTVLDQQVGVVDRLGAKTDRVDDGVRRNRNELDKIRRKIQNSLPTKLPTSQARVGVDETVAVKHETKEQKNISKNTSRRDTFRDQSRPVKWTDDLELLKTRKSLPIWSYRSQIQAVLRRSDLLIIVGETGSGKSTQTPQFLFREPWCRRQTKSVKLADGTQRQIEVGGMIAVTQPRRVAATTLAHRVSQEAGCSLGKSTSGLVGYSVRFDHNVPKGTKIKFLTEGMLLQELLRDPCLCQYSAIIVDEIHERSIDVDLLSGFLKEIQSSDLSGRGGIPLKIVVMSATADVGRIKEFFAPQQEVKDEFPDSTKSSEAKPTEILYIKGRQYPVQISHSPKPVPDLQDGLVRSIFKLHTEEPLPGDILAFLTGQEEIESAQRLIEDYAATLASNVPKVKVFPLFGQLSIEAQHAAFQPIKDAFTRKIVLATNIAETSVTVPGVRYVVDCGKAKVKEFRSRLGLESLLAKPISRSSAIQRAGRAGREGAGKCVRLYTQDGYESLAERDLPEILRNDVLGAILTMKACGIRDVQSFPLMDRPDTDAILKALGYLHSLRAIADDGAITDVGRRLAKFPISASFGAVLLAAAESQFDCVLEVIDVISCITSGEDIFYRLLSEEDQEQVEETRKELYRREGDIVTYLTTMQQYTAEHADRVQWCKKRRINIRNMRMAVNIRRQLRGLCLKEGLLAEPPLPDPQPFEPLPPDRAERLLKCFMRGFVSKTALLHPDGSYVTIQGKHTVAIHPSSVLHGVKREAIMFLEHVFTQKSYAKKVSAIEAPWIVEELEGSSGVASLEL